VVVEASGSSKTTLLRLLLGAVGWQGPMYCPEAGEIEAPPSVQAQAPIPGEVEPDLGEEPILEATYRVTGDEALALEVLNYAGISDGVLYRAPYRELSTGQKVRAQLAYLLAHRPNLLLIDEFAAHLDPIIVVPWPARCPSWCGRRGSPWWW